MENNCRVHFNGSRGVARRWKIMSGGNRFGKNQSLKGREPGVRSLGQGVLQRSRDRACNWMTGDS